MSEVNEEAKEILLEIGFSTNKAEEKSIDLRNALKRRGLVKEEIKPKVKKKDVFEIKDDYIKEGD